MAKRSSNPPPPAAEPQLFPASTAEAPAPPAARSSERPVRRPRPDIVQQTIYLPRAVHEQLRSLAFAERVKMHDVLMQGLDLAFKQRGLKSIAELANDS